jgi:hypothetical protein
VEEVAKSATRALGAVIAKCKAHGNVPYDCFTYLYDSLVQPIIDYGSAIWGHKEFSCIKSVQFRACRFFMKVGRYTPNSAVMGDMGWSTPQHRIYVNIIRQWCRLSHLPETRLNHRTFAWAISDAMDGCRTPVKSVITFLESVQVNCVNSLQCVQQQALTDLGCKLSSYFHDV